MKSSIKRLPSKRDADEEKLPKKDWKKQEYNIHSSLKQKNMGEIIQESERQ